MSYQKYLNEGVIIGMNEWGENGRILKILTREGIRSLVATGVRELGSKMRSEIDVLTKVEFEYVEGKDVSRLVGIFPKERLLRLNDEYVIQNLLKIRNTISNVTNFTLRVVIGETPNDRLYESFVLGMDRIQNREFELKDTQVLEIIWLIKILVSLGYWEEGKMDDFGESNIIYISTHQKEIVDEINKSIESSHM